MFPQTPRKTPRKGLSYAERNPGYAEANLAAAIQAANKPKRKVVYAKPPKTKKRKAKKQKRSVIKKKRKTKKTKKSSKLKFYQGGYVSVKETHVNVSAVYAGYFSFNCGNDEIMIAAIASIWQKHMLKQGVNIRNWRDPFSSKSATGVDDEYRWTLLYLVADNGNSIDFVRVSSQAGTALSHIDWVNNMVGAIRTRFFDLGFAPTFLSSQVEMIHFQNAATSFLDLPVSRINLETLKLEFDCDTTVMVQNITKAGDGTQANDDESTDILKQPLLMQLYKCDKWKTGYMGKYRQAQTTQFIPGGTSGQQWLTSEQVDSVGSTTNNYRALPPAWMFSDDHKAVGRRVVEPGETTKYSQNFKCEIYFNTFVRKFQQTFYNQGAGIIQEFNKCYTIGVQRKLSASRADIACTFNDKKIVRCRAITKLSKTAAEYYDVA